MRFLVALLVLCTGCAPWDAPECTRDSDCDHGSVCHGGACLRYQLPPGNPYDPEDGGRMDATMDASADVTEG